MKLRLFLYSFHLFLLLHLAFGAAFRLLNSPFNVVENPASNQMPEVPAQSPEYHCFHEPPSPYLEKFIEPLTFPPVLDISDGGPPLTIGAYKIAQKLHRDLPNTTFYAFGTSQETATFPGPTFMARRYIPARVRWENHIPDEFHFLPLDDLISWARPRRGGVPVVAHIHGLEVPSIYDGNPDAWFTPKNETGPVYVTQDYVYPNRQYPTALWYHDHTMGITRLNVLAGLSGFYIIRPTEEEEEMLNLPEGLLISIRDMQFYANGSIRLGGPSDFDPSLWCAEWFDTWLVNGKVWPFLRVYAKPYRLRILNASNGRYAGLYFSHGLQNLTCLQIGTSGGFLDEPMSVENFLIFSADRIDVVVDFSALESGAEVILSNFPLPVDANDAPPLSSRTSVVMKFIVVEDGGTDEGMITDPDYMERLTRNMQRMAKANENKAHMIAQPGQIRTINIRDDILNNSQILGFIFGNETWEDPVTISPVVGSTEIWEIINLSNAPHPIHVHLVQFQVLNQQRIDTDSYRNNQCSTSIAYPNDGTCFLDYPQSPSVDQIGWKDLVVSWDNYVLRILLQFTTREGKPFSFDPTQGPGYLFHCHILQHEDHFMMRPYVLHYEEDNIY